MNKNRQYNQQNKSEIEKYVFTKTWKRTITALISENK